MGVWKFSKMKIGSDEGPMNYIQQRDESESL